MPYDIPVGEEAIPGQSSVYIGARQSRFGMEGMANTKVGQIRTYMEVDFASSTSSVWRLRHAFAEWNFFKLGYTWTTFMDNASIPTTVDFEGPNSALDKKHGLIRYERKYGERSVLGFSFESPRADYDNPADTLYESTSKQRNFDIAGRYKQSNSWGHVQVAGIFRRISYLHQGNIDVLYGFGILLSSAVLIREKHQFYMQYSIGNGIANYFVGYSDRKLDAIYDPVTDDMKLKGIQGGFISYTYVYNSLWIWSLTAGLSSLDTEDFEPENSFKSSQYFAANVFYTPIETIRVGLEVTSGTRTNLDKQKGHATRISAIARFDF
jgi:hypothetical protein